MGRYAPNGGFIVTTPDKKYIHPQDGNINQEKLHQIAEILGIPKADRDKLKAETIRTIFVYGPTEFKG